ncbi:hypothetical protein V6L77_26190 [Pannonibacter sp. Pt2-lr]
MADGNALFHTTHKNLAGTGAALDVAASVRRGRRWPSRRASTRRRC